MVLLTKRYLAYQGLRGERGKDGRPGEVVRSRLLIVMNNKLPSVIFVFFQRQFSFTATKTRSVVEEINQTRVTVFYHILNREES